MGKKKQEKAAVTIQEQARCWLYKQKFFRELEAKKAEMKLVQELNDLEKNTKKKDESHKAELQKILDEERDNLEDTKDRIRDEIRAEIAKNKKKDKTSDAVDESQKIIEYLRKANAKVRGQNDTMKKDFRALKENNQRLMEANASAASSFNALNDHAKQLGDINEKLKTNVGMYKKQHKKMKDDLQLRQNYYKAEASARLTYQKTLSKIVQMVQDDCRQDELVADIVQMSIAAATEAKIEQLPGGAVGAAAAPKAVDSDSD